MCRLRGGKNSKCIRVRDAPSERTTDESVADIAKKYQTGLDAAVNHSSGSALFRHLLLWSHVWNPDGIQGLQYIQGRLGKPLGGTEAF